MKIMLSNTIEIVLFITKFRPRKKHLPYPPHSLNGSFSATSLKPYYNQNVLLSYNRSFYLRTRNF